MSRKSTKQAVFQPRIDELPKSDESAVSSSSMNTITKFKYADVGLNEYAQIIFKELNQIAERLKKVQINLVDMNDQIAFLETC